MAKSFSALEKNILKSKGMTDAQVKKLAKAGVKSRDDFKTVRDAATLASLIPGLASEAAASIIAWGLSDAGGASVVAGGNVVVESPDVVYCVHCKAKQPKDYSSGDLCVSCGKQAEPILSCYWCSRSGPGKFCRQCGAEFIATSELDLAIHLKREGLAKDEIPSKLRAMSAADKDTLWGRIRKSRG
ncbi:MAG TPA: hypothetical protein VL860_06590 [Planctomycetota bacterium]|nr:hypothetical protein [Planctomycetota bacterium]